MTNSLFLMITLIIASHIKISQYLSVSIRDFLPINLLLSSFYLQINRTNEIKSHVLSGKNFLF